MRKYLAVCTLIILFLSSCANDDISSGYELEQITGYSQKGPFTIGSTVTLIELNNQLNQTGRTFNSIIRSDLGDFEFSNISLESNFAMIQVNGFYFNEITGALSNSPINLRAIVDFNSNSTMNINLITHLEVERVLFLVQEGMSFSDAKLTANQEILDILNLENEEETESENLNLTDSQNLLTFSAVFQAFRSEAEIVELLSVISLDIEEDGILSNVEIGTSLVTQASYLDGDVIQNNLIQRYSNLGIDIDIPYINNHLENFILNTEFIYIDPLDYPETGWSGFPNLLNSNNDIFQLFNYDITIANVPDWAKVKVKFMDNSNNLQAFRWGSIEISPDGIIYSGEGWQINDGILESSESFNDCGCALDNYFTGIGTLTVYINEKEHWNRTLTIIE